MLVQPQLPAVLQITRTGQFTCALGQPAGIFAGSAGGGLAHQLFAHPQGDGDIFSLHPAAQVMPPRVESVHPGQNRVFVAAQFLHLKLAAPAVVDQHPHRRFPPDGFAGLAVLQEAGQRIVAIGEDVRFNRDGVAHGALDREPAAIQFRGDAFDDHSLAAIDRPCGGCRFDCRFRGGRFSQCRFCWGGFRGGGWFRGRGDDCRLFLMNRRFGYRRSGFGADPFFFIYCRFLGHAG